MKNLRAAVYEANLALVKEGLVVHTWGNASAIDRERGVMIIKPSGVPYDDLRPENMAVVDLATAKVLEGTFKPSSDTPTHLELYRAFEGIGGVVHTHSLYATAWAQANQSIPALGTTHADYFHGPVPCSRLLTRPEIEGDYETETGKVIVATFAGRDPLSCPAVLVGSHGPFTWGTTVGKAVENASVLEYVARLASEALRIFPSAEPMQQVLMEKHFFRKHGSGAYYGQGAC